MKEQLISLEIAKLAKEKGFIDFSKSPDNIPTHITQSLLQKWLREVHNIHIEIYSNALGWGYILTKLNGTTIKEIEDDLFYAYYEEALEIGLQTALKLIKSI